MTLKDNRAELLSVLEAAQIAAFYGMGVFSAPCARIFPGEPWVSLEGRASGRRSQIWEVWAVAGKADAVATFDELEAMVIAIDTALEPLPQWSRPTWHDPPLPIWAVRNTLPVAVLS